MGEGVELRMYGAMREVTRMGADEKGTQKSVFIRVHPYPEFLRLGKAVSRILPYY